MEFRLISSKQWVPDTGKNVAYLQVDNWNDYSFVTQFSLSLFDSNGDKYEVGGIKIGFKGQTEEEPTHILLPKSFSKLEMKFFSVGQSAEFYEEISKLPVSLGEEVLSALNDVVLNPSLIDAIENETVWGTSLLRHVSLSDIKGQFSRVLQGKNKLTDFNFGFNLAGSEEICPVSMSFEVEVDSTPSTNVHAIIGRNGVGKTTLLNSMISTLTNFHGSRSKFIDLDFFGNEVEKDYFRNLVSVSFSAFDPFKPPKERSNSAKGPSYYYVGLKDANGGHLDSEGLKKTTTKALVSCFSDAKKTKYWLEAIEMLGLDVNFSSKNSQRLLEIYKECREKDKSKKQSDTVEFQEGYSKAIKNIWNDMSSGHAIVLLTITRLVATVGEKTIVLLDEPESHLHPPLLSAFIRALTNLLLDHNGIAIIATHSPVVLQEIPKSCVWKVYRVGSNVTCNRPGIETFGENVGVLTREVFGLELEKSGYHDLLAQSVDSGESYASIIKRYGGQIGIEGRSILMAMIASRDKSDGGSDD